MSSMKEQQELLQQYVSDMLALEKHIHDAVKRQRDDKATEKFGDAHRLVSRLEASLDQRIAMLERHLEQLGGDSGSPVKDAVSSALGAVAGMYDKIRSSTVAKMLRDDYTALSLSAISYTMLNTTALALNSPGTAQMALSHLKEVTPVITELSRLIPLIVAQELSAEEVDANTTVGAESIQQTQQAWDAAHVNRQVFA